jgi:hypothetical protein
MEMNEKDTWVSGKLAVLRPEWEAKPSRAAVLLKERLEARPRFKGWVIAMAASTAMVALALALPEGRLKAEEIWQRFFMKSFAVVRLELSNAPFRASIESNGMTREFQSLVEAASFAGFEPEAPAGIAFGKSVVTGPIKVKQVVDVPALRQALERVGAHDLKVPGEWSGVTIRMEVGPMVISEVEGDAQIIQAKPFELQLPSGFPLARFSEAVFRSLGVPAWKAALMANQFAKNPAWLLDVPEDEAVELEEVRIGDGTGLLLVDPSEEKAERATLLFSAKGKIFAVSSASKERSLQLARRIE